MLGKEIACILLCPAVAFAVIHLIIHDDALRFSHRLKNHLEVVMRFDRQRQIGEVLSRLVDTDMLTVPTHLITIARTRGRTTAGRLLCIIGVVVSAKAELSVSESRVFLVQFPTRRRASDDGHLKRIIVSGRYRETPIVFIFFITVFHI